MFTPLHELTAQTLLDLGTLLQGNESAAGVSARRLEQILGVEAANRVTDMLARAGSSGWSLRQVGEVAMAIASARRGAGDPEKLFDLVLSGPDAPGVPTRDTAAVMQTLLEGAREEVVLVGYAVYNGKRLFRTLAERMAANSSLKVTFCLNIERKRGDTTVASDIVARFLADFKQRHWPWRPLPRIFYDPRALEPDQRSRAALHAKIVIVDRSAALITSANFTEAAQRRNVEAGVLITHPPFVIRISDYFSGLQRHVFVAAE